MRRLVYVRKDAVHVDDLRHKTRHMWDRVGILVADRKVICSGRCTGMVEAWVGSFLQVAKTAAPCRWLFGARERCHALGPS